MPSSAGTPDLTASCRSVFDGSENDSNLADNIEAAHPSAACETVSVNENSPGPVKDDELVYRILVSPVDFDDAGLVLESPFQKVYRNGVSAMRSIASKSDIEQILHDRLSSTSSREAKQVRAIFGAKVGGANGLREQIDDDGERLFGVYDQVVSRLDPADEPVPTHCGIFLRRPAKGATGRKRLQKDHAGRLRELFLEGQLELEDFFEGVALEINASFASAM